MIHVPNKTNICSEIYDDRKEAAVSSIRQLQQDLDRVVTGFVVVVTRNFL